MPGGRPSKKSNLDLKRVEALAKRGWTDEEMARFFEVATSTWYRWKAEDAKFSEALKNWKDEADARVERSLYERAIGYEHPDVHASNYQGTVTLTPIQKKYPPDTTAAIFWLKNRQPDQWRDKQEIAATVNDVSERRESALDALERSISGLTAAIGSGEGSGESDN